MGLFIIFTTKGPMSHCGTWPIGQTEPKRQYMIAFYINNLIHILHWPFHNRTVKETINHFKLKARLAAVESSRVGHREDEY
jgi:hypothetical protein